MEIKKNHWYRIKRTDGLIVFGKIKYIEKDFVIYNDFADFSPKQTDIKLLLQNIAELDPYKIDDIPPYE